MDIYFQQEQSVASALRLEKRLKKEAIYNSQDPKSDIDIAEMDHSLGMKGLKVITEKQYSVKNLNSSEELVNKQSIIDLLFDNIKKTNHQNGFFFYKQNKNLEEQLSSGLSPNRIYKNSIKLKGRQLSLPNYQKPSFQVQEQEIDLRTNKHKNDTEHPLHKQMSEPTYKYSENKQIDFDQLGKFLNSINYIKYTKSVLVNDTQNKSNNEEEEEYEYSTVIDASNQTKLHEQFWQLLSCNSVNQSHSVKGISRDIAVGITNILIVQENEKKSNSELKDQIKALLQSTNIAKKDFQSIKIRFLFINIYHTF